VHDTPASALKEGPGPGRVTSVHAVPFHVSPSVPALLSPTAEADPIAVHEVADMQDTPASSSMPVVPAGLGVAWMAQVVPFQASASVAASGPPVLAAVPAPGPGHAPRPSAPQAARRAAAPGRTPRGPRGAPDRVAAWMEAPTAVHVAAALHETPYRRLTIAPAGSGTVRTFQVLPSHA